MSWSEISCRLDSGGSTPECARNNQIMLDCISRRAVGKLPTIVSDRSGFVQPFISVKANANRAIVMHERMDSLRMRTETLYYSKQWIHRKSLNFSQRVDTKAVDENKARCSIQRIPFLSMAYKRPLDVPMTISSIATAIDFAYPQTKSKLNLPSNLLQHHQHAKSHLSMYP